MNKPVHSGCVESDVEGCGACWSSDTDEIEGKVCFEKSVLDLLQKSLDRSSLARACGAEEHHTKGWRWLSRRDRFENVLHVLENNVYEEHLVVVTE